jgi:phage anti-repressor protein
LNFKNQYSNKVSLLLGNHELHYFKDVKIKYSRFNKNISERIEDILIQAFDSNLIQLVEKIDDVTYSHA